MVSILINFSPEVYLFCSFLFYMISIFVERHFFFIYFLLIQSMLLVLFNYYMFPLNLSFHWSFVLSSSNYIWFIKFILIIFFILFLLVSYNYIRTNVFEHNRLKESMVYGIFEFLLICFLYLFSAFIFISANDFLLVYIFLEIMSICLYILAAFSFESNRSAESSLKYFLFGAQFSGLFVLGWLFIYMSTGLSNFFDLQDFFDNLRTLTFLYLTDEGIVNSYLIIQYRLAHIGIFFIFLSILAKLGLYPFQQWMIDVYDGSSNLSVFFFSIFPKIVLFAFLLRFYLLFFSIIYFGLLDFVFFFSAFFSVLYGGLINLSQWRIKRFIVFSSLVNLGYILFFFSVSTTLFSFYDLILGVVLNLVLYVISVFFLFAIYLNTRPVRAYDVIGDMNELSVLKNSHPQLGLLFVFIMLSFAGIPPLMGFFGKYYLLSYLWIMGAYSSMIIILLFSLFACFYYIRLSRVFFNFSSVYGIYRNASGSLAVILFLFILLQFFFIFYFINFISILGDFLFLGFL